MQQENVTLDSVATVENQETIETRGPALLQPEMLAWVCGGVSMSEELPRAGW